MASFAIILTTHDLPIDEIVENLINVAPSILSGVNSRTTQWAPIGCRSMRVIVWHGENDAPAHDGENFSFNQGWRIEYNQEILGEYLDLHLDINGSGAIKRNKTGIYPIYRADISDCTIISTNSTICAYIQNGSSRFSINPNYVAIGLAVGWPMFDPTMFDGVTAIKPGEEPTFRNGALHDNPNTTLEPFFRADFNDHYLTDPSSFWDLRTSELQIMLQQFFEDDRPKIETFSISGGKDSRLLLAALLQYPAFKEHVTLRTIGSPYHGDAVVAASIADHYGLSHNLSDVVFSTMNLDIVIRDHCFVTEGRCAPTVPIRAATNPPRGLALYGHELGLRDPYSAPIEDFSKRSVTEYIFQRSNDFNIAKFLSLDAHNYVKSLASARIDHLYEITKDPRNVGWRFYIESRLLHYVTNIKQTGELVSHAPYPLLTDIAGEMSYSIGRDARLEERPHYEMMRRLEPWLTYRVPFNSQKWPLALRLKESEHTFSSSFPLHSSDKAPSSGVYAALSANRSAFRDFVFDRIEKFDSIVDRDLLEACFERPNWQAHEFGAIMNLIMFCGADGADWAELSPGSKSSPYPPIRYSTVPVGQTQDAGKNKLYLEIIPSAIMSIARIDQARLILSDVWEMQAAGRHDEAFPLICAAAALGAPAAHFQLGRAFLEGKYVARNVGMGLRYLESAFDAGFAGSGSTLGDIYLKGEEVPENKAKALRFFESAARAGDPWSGVKAAKLQKLFEIDPTEMWDLAYKAFIKRGVCETNPYAAFQCYEIASVGLAGKSDPIVAGQHLKRAAELDHPKAKAEFLKTKANE